MKKLKKRKGKKKKHVKEKVKEIGKKGIIDGHVFRKKAPRRKVKVEVEIDPKAFKGTGSVFKLFS